MAQLIDMMDYRAKRKGYTQEQLAAFARMGAVTFYRRRKEPGMFKLEELQRLAIKLNMRIVLEPDGTIKAEAEL